MGIDHNKLLVKLEHYGIRVFCHKLLTNYLLKREQYINFKGTESEVQEVEFWLFWPHFLKISTSNLFCPASTIRFIGKPNKKSVGPKITSLAPKKPHKW